MSRGRNFFQATAWKKAVTEPCTAHKINKMKIVLIGGHPKGFKEPFDIKTKSGKVLREIIRKLNMNPVFFDLWNNQKEEDERIIKPSTNKNLLGFIKNKYTLIALGRYIEKAILDKGYKCKYLPHPASRDIKYIKLLKGELAKLK